MEPRGPGNDPSQHESGRATQEHRYDEELLGKAHKKNRSFQDLLNKNQKSLSFEDFLNKTHWKNLSFKELLNENQ